MDFILFSLIIHVFLVIQHTVHRICTRLAVKPVQ